MLLPMEKRPIATFLVLILIMLPVFQDSTESKFFRGIVRAGQPSWEFLQILVSLSPLCYTLCYRVCRLLLPCSCLVVEPFFISWVIVCVCVLVSQCVCVCVCTGKKANQF